MYKGDKCSSFINFIVAFPQYPLGPILFSMHIKDLPQVCLEVNVQIYVHNTIFPIQDVKNILQASG